MRNFDYKNIPLNLYTPEITEFIISIHEHKCKVDYILKNEKIQLKELSENTKIKTLYSISKLNEYKIAEKRINEIVNMQLDPKNSEEKIILGYSNAIDTILENYNLLHITKKVILDLYNFLDDDVEIDPIKCKELDDLCENYNTAINLNKYNSLILNSIFINDFLCLKPFKNHNELLSMLLTLLVCYKQGYCVGGFISIETLIERTNIFYKNALNKSSLLWEENKNNYIFFAEYILAILEKAYKELDKKVISDIKNKTEKDTNNDTNINNIDIHINVNKKTKKNTNKNLTKSDRIREIFGDRLEKISKREIMLLNPDISKVTIERTLAKLVKEEYILKVGSGVATAYIKNIK